MKFSNQKVGFFSLIWIGIVFLCSCAPTRSYRPYEEGVRIIVNPHKLSVHSGSEDKVYVQILDKQGGPLFGIKVTATSTLPTVATVTSEALTDPVGKAMFTVSGISPGTTQVVLSAAGQKATMEVVFIGH
ncbi:conserved hypothetical protein [Candidatus Brocadia pituitae]|nr:conserved hypothetical protein [Candidatus Brocadia pituitae]